ncbi:hypothetical protein [Halospeciosus flavus]|uniref:Tetratricopeptide repeat protein n=2 Tax=Halospeciosus flavus TaxID=3032283 RepID=A0ABD5Z9E9_9EURY|nr:hypothetical protein [Halospeciosus flavus]
MTRSRWTRPLPEAVAVDDPTATVTRVVGEHELDGAERHRRYEVRLPGVVVAESAVRTRGADLEVSEGSGGVRLAVTVPDGAGVARVRVPVSPHDWAAFRLPGPSFGEQCTAARRGDEGAAAAVRDAFADPVALALACGEFLDAEALVDLLGVLAAGDGAFADRLHGARYDVLRSLAVTPAAAAVDDGETFERVVSGLDDLDDVGDVGAVDALADVVAVCHDTVASTRRFVDDFGYDLPALERRDDGRFFAVVLAHVVRCDGVAAAMAHANRHGAGDVDYGETKRRAEAADYWERGAAWRALVRPAAQRDRQEFAYVLANACYWSGETTRSDSRLEELLHEGAAAAAASIDLDWIEGRARFQRHRAAGHRHRSSRTYALALDRFERAEAVAAEYDFLDPGEPLFSRTIVRSNRLARRGEVGRAVDVLEDGATRVRECDVPEERREEMLHHLDGQRHERLARLTDEDDATSRREHLEAAADHYRAIDFERSAERVETKLDETDPFAAAEADADDTEYVSRARGSTRTARPKRERGVAPETVPDLDDYLTEPAPDAVGSPDPGVLPDECGGDPHASPGPHDSHDPYADDVDDEWY